MLFYLKVANFSFYILFPLIGFNLFAQEFEIAKIQSTYFPNQNIKDSLVKGEIGFLETGAQVAFPHSLKNKKTFFVHKVHYVNLKVNSEVHLPLSSINSSKYYHSFSYNLGFVQTIKKNWRMVLNFNPTLASDLRESLSEDDFFYQANAFLINTINKLKYGFGATYTTQAGRQLIIPIGIFKYNTTKVDLDFLLPNKMNIMLKTKNNFFSYGLKVTLDGGVFNNTTEILPVTKPIDKVGYSRLILGPAIVFRLKDAVNINLQSGMTVGRRLELIDEHGEIVDWTPKSTPFVGMTISFAPKIKNSEAAINN